MKDYVSDAKGRKTGIKGYYDELTKGLGEEFALKEKGLALEKEGTLADFLNKSQDIRTESDVARSKANLAYSGTIESGVEREEKIQRNEILRALEGFGLQGDMLEQQERKERAQLDKQRIDELQRLEDLIYQAESSLYT